MKNERKIRRRKKNNRNEKLIQKDVDAESRDPIG
jgi:hypothetical protein